MIVLSQMDTDNIRLNIEAGNNKQYKISAYIKWTIQQVVEVCKEVNEERCDYLSLILYGNELDPAKTVETYNIGNGSYIFF